MIIRTTPDLVEDKLVKAGYQMMNSDFRGTIFAVSRFDKQLPNAVKIYVVIYPATVDYSVQSQRGLLAKGRFEKIDTDENSDDIAEAISNYIDSLEKIYG